MRVFISHSSKDKERYCDKVKEHLIKALGKDNIVYDTVTFEAGEKSIDEINRTLADSSLYVILLSGTAVESKWVRHELSEAREKLSNHALDRIYPLIIDSQLKYSDKRIPSWLKDYNLKYIARPSKAAKLIIERAKNVNWTRHPENQQKSTIFVGRNDLVQEVESRLDNYDLPPVNTYIVSGIPNIGRKSLIKYCLIKSSVIPAYYDFPTISLSYQESIEDFIIKINDLGFTDISENIDLPSANMEQKIMHATMMSKEISDLNEIILIKDSGCIIDYRGNLATWFESIVNSPSLSDQMTFIIVTKYKCNYESIRNVPSSNYINVPELNQSERKGLLRRLATTYNLELDRQKLDTIGKYLTGYPSQVFYAVELIQRNGYPYLVRNFKLLQDFNEREVSLLLEKHKDNEKVYQILALIAKYDAISCTMLYEILSVTPDFTEYYEQLFQESLFELEGTNKEYIRLNEVVRNYITRSGAKINPAHQKKAQELFENMFRDPTTSWYNSNDFLLAVRESVLQGKKIPADKMIPSVYLKGMTDMYSNMEYENVIKLARRALQNSDNMDDRIIYEIRYWLCSSLAKIKDSTCLQEMQTLNYENRTFLQAFYYRQIGKNDRALQRLNELLQKNPKMAKAKREKVLVLKNLQQFEEATGLAKENYYLSSDNPYHIQAYFDCLINTYLTNPQDNILSELLDRLDKIYSEKAQSMYARCNALYLAYVENDYSAAIIEIDRGISDFPRDRKYALVVKFEIAKIFRDKESMRAVIADLKADKASNNTIVICESKLLASENKTEAAIKYFTSNIQYFTEDSKHAFCEKLGAHTLCNT